LRVLEFGRSQRMVPAASSAARSALRATRRASSRPAVGVEHGGVEFVVQLFQHGDQAFFVVQLFLGVQRSPRRTFSSTLYMPVSVRSVGGLLALAVGVDLFGERADAGLLLGVAAGKGKVSKQRDLL
jgi:2-keto-3-deoxy-L-rhamnonate aldolase RhmA